MTRAGDAPPRRIIASGLLTAEGDAVAAAFTPLGFAVGARRSRDEWAALLLERPSAGG